MTYSAQISFHGVAQVVIGEVSTHRNPTGKEWQSVSLTFYGERGDILDMVQILSGDNSILVVEHEKAAAA